MSLVMTSLRTRARHFIDDCSESLRIHWLVEHTDIGAMRRMDGNDGRIAGQQE